MNQGLTFVRPVVYARMVLHETTQESFALKSMLREDIKAQRSEQSVLDEKELMIESTHPFIVNLVNTYKSSKRLYMLMECVQGGELYSRIHKNKEAGGLDTISCAFYASNVVIALNHMHSKDIVYRDLKPENVLIDSAGESRSS
jgi:cGMP-dependent protein kinase